MSAPVTSATAWQWPADVLEFAAKENIQACLDPLLEATRRVFPTARAIKVGREDDPEIRDAAAIVFEVQVADFSAAQARAAQKAWNRELLRCCPTPRVSDFGLVLNLVP
jgi:hypothetical protein